MKLVLNLALLVSIISFSTQISPLDGPGGGTAIGGGNGTNVVKGK
jgi:hypothetical protein